MSSKKPKVEQVAAEAPRDSRDYVENSPRGTVKYRNFDEFWSWAAREKALDPSLKTHVWTYFRSTGILNTPSAYLKGLEQFGL